MVIKHLQRVFFALMLLLLCGFGNSARASHLAAADLYLDYIGTGPNDLTYRITLVIYKACEIPNAGLGNTANISIKSVSCNQNLGNFSIPMTQGPDTMDQLCPDFAPVNSCREINSPWPAFERRIYTTTYTLPMACTDWIVGWGLGARNAGIENLNNPDSYNMYVEAGINNVAKWDNSSPRFIIDPIPYLCAGQPSFFLNGPLDPDNDSMITMNVDPWDNHASPIPFKAPYNLANPFNSATGYNVNPNTGTATFIPNTSPAGPVPGKYVMAFECTDYMRTFPFTKLSWTRRDVQVSALNCNAAPPNISQIPENIIGGGWDPAGYVLACPGIPLSFEVKASSNSISNSVYLTANNQAVIPASSFNVTNQGLSDPSGVFSWTPTGNDYGDYTVIFTAKDSTCDNNQPIVLKNYMVAFIKVLPGLDGGPDGRICEIDGVPWQFNVSGPDDARYIWTALDGTEPLGLSNDTIANPTAKPPYNFTYIVSAPNIVSACKNRDTMQVYIDTSNAVLALPKDAVQCRPGYINLDAEGVGLRPLENLQCGTFDIQSCSVEDTLVIASQFAGGTPLKTKQYNPFLKSRTARMQFLIPKSDLSAYGVRSGTIRGLAFDVDALPDPATYDNVVISIGCTDRKTLSNTEGGFEQGLTPVFTSTGPIAVTTGWNQFTFDTPYSRDSTKSLIVEFCYSNSAQGTMAATVNSVITNTEQMIFRDANTGTASICQDASIGSAPIAFKARPIIRLNYCPGDSLDFAFTWYPGTYMSDSTIKSPLVYIPQTSTYHVTTIGRNGCKVIDSTIVKVPVHTYDVWPKDTTLCYNEPFKMLATGDFDNVKWYETNAFSTATNIDCDDCKEPMAVAVENTIYKAVLTDKDGCSDTFKVNVKIKPLPTVKIVNRDTVLKYGQSMQLLASGAFLYSWSPVSTLTNPNIVNPVAAPTEPTMYYVQGLGENGCRNVDSIKIDIDYRDNLFVPSAFTPNGDGKNDVFRVTNITFQNLQEFRVFNRWGQEIFSTTDHRKGWDGSWKGVPQDMGAYQYLIRVAYPDGLIETYKGDVTLVR